MTEYGHARAIERVFQLFPEGHGGETLLWFAENVSLVDSRDELDLAILRLARAEYERRSRGERSSSLNGSSTNAY